METTSYELSMKLKEAGIPQEGGEYYWVEIMRSNFNTQTLKMDHRFEFGVKHKSELVDRFNKYTPICRAMTLGDLVRILGSINAFKTSRGSWAFCISDFGKIHHSYTPEEAAGVMCLEFVNQQSSKQPKR